MQSTQTPTLIPLAFAANGTKNSIPEASQIGIVDGAASLNDGFPPLTRTPIAAGGKPPSGADMNGILYLVSAPIRWHQAGGKYGFNSAFAADTNVGGYPSGAELLSADMQGTWLSLIDNNTDDPDTGPGTNWVPGRAYGVTAISGLTNANVTLTPAQAAKNKITLAGTLTGNIQIILPTWTRDWTIVNNTTGAFTVTAKTAAGTGIVLAAGQQKITGDGTNIVQPIESVTTPPQFDSSTKLANMAALTRQGIQASGVSVISATSALTAANAGGTAFLTASSATTQTLPALSTFPIGARVEFINAGTGTATIAQNAADSNGFVTNGGARPSSMTLGPGDTLTVEKVDVTGTGTYAWACVIGSAQLGSAGVFGASLSSAGYQKLPSGLLIQWGQNTGGTSGAATYSFPIAFTSSVYAMSGTEANVNANARAAANAISVSQFQVSSLQFNGTTYAADSILWIAVGK